MLRITGGKVYDPANGINGEVRDICIADGKIVAAVEGGRTIDATGMIVFPGGVDIHTHVAGAALNFARALTPENQRVAAKFQHQVGRLVRDPATVTKLAEDRAEQLKRDTDKVAKELDARLRTNLQKTGDFSRIHPLPHSGADVPDDLDAVFAGQTCAVSNLDLSVPASFKASSMPARTCRVCAATSPTASGNVPQT